MAVAEAFLGFLLEIVARGPIHLRFGTLGEGPTVPNWRSHNGGMGSCWRTVQGHPNGD